MHTNETLRGYLAENDAKKEGNLLDSEGRARRAKKSEDRQGAVWDIQNHSGGNER